MARTKLTATRVSEKTHNQPAWLLNRETMAKEDFPHSK